jgi:class 3 adenylate cyclase
MVATARPSWKRRFAEVERLVDASSSAGLAELDVLTSSTAAPADIRAQAFALKAIVHTRTGSERGWHAAEDALAAGNRLRGAGAMGKARLAHARGYLAFRRGEAGLVLPELNRAVDLAPDADRMVAQVFDTLGMHFLHTVGHLERARAYFEQSLERKRRCAAQSPEDAAREQVGIGITLGNLGRLALMREQFEEAERWFREDLEVATGGQVAIVRNLIAQALAGQGRLDEADRELTQAVGLAPKGSITHAYVLKDLGRFALRRNDTRASQSYLREAREVCEVGGYAEVLLHVRLAEGMLATTRAQRHDDDATLAALAAFEDARTGFTRIESARELCETAVALAALYEKIGRPQDALAALVKGALPVAERSLFDQLQPLARIEAKIAALDPAEHLRLRLRRMLGGVRVEEHTSRLRAERQRLTVWTCDIRGFTEFCEKSEPLLVVDLLNRFFARVGRHLLDHAAVIDKYVGDNILAYFRDARAAAGVALAAMEIVRELNVESRHLSLPQLRIGIGLASGQVVLGNLGFAGKLEHTAIGAPVNTACRLVGVADPEEILVDERTAEQLAGSFRTKPRKTVALKGLPPSLKIFRLEGRGRK